MLSALGAMTASAFSRQIIDLGLARTSRQITTCEHAIVDDPRLPLVARTAFLRYRHAFQRNARRPEFFVPIEFRTKGSVAAGYRALQVHLGTLAELIDAWPAMWTLAANERLDQE
jgi:hypothetical protein